MKITKSRLQEIIREEAQLELPGLGPPDACAPADDIENLSAQVANLILDSEFGIEEYGDIVDAAMDKIAEATPELGTAEDGDGHEASGEYSGEYSGLGFRESIRRMVREALGDRRQRSVRSGKWVVRREGVSDEDPEAYLTGALVWGPKAKAKESQFEPEARGLRKAAIARAAKKNTILDGIENADIVDISERRLPKVTRAMIDRLQTGVNTGKWDE